MPHALLLSPDDQAVSAITGVLEEMSVTCERPLDGPSAAKKLNSHSFDLVLVDCENLPAAKLIFDVCRRSQTGTNPVPIAIVDGRAGLPTAFRLGAELILTKPVAKDQARTTIRTAVSRVRKDESSRPIQPFEDAPAATPAPLPEKLSQAAAASAASTSPKGADVAPPMTSAQPSVAKMSSAADEIASVPAPKPQPAASRDVSPMSFSAPPKPSPLQSSAPVNVSDDPVLADLEADLPTPVFTSYHELQKKKKGRGMLVSLLLLVLAGGGFYAAWMYQPGFREIAQPQINRALALVGMQIPTPATSPKQVLPKPAVTTPAPATPSVAVPPAPTAPSDTAPTTSAAPIATPTNAPAPIQQAAVPSPQTATGPTSGVTTATSAEKIPAPDDSKKNVIAALPSDTELPGEKSAVILSSQGAEKRLLHHQQPDYPAQARRERLEGTVVLKAVVSEGGKVEGVRLVEGNPTLAAAAVHAVKQWRYRPYVRDGKARPFQTIVLVEFQRP